VVFVQRPLFFQTRAHVFVCTGPNCVRDGARGVFASTWKTLEAKKVAYYRDGGTVRLTESGCQGACGHGPNAIVYFVDASGTMREGYYTGLDAERLIAIATAVHEQRDPGPANRYGGG
jgi:(2Fe-2S) ferredoxin